MRWLGLVALIACGGSDPPVDPDASYGREAVPLGLPTGATCTDATLSYETFGRNFMVTYCTRCHASTLQGEARMGAPALHDFDAVFAIRPVASHVDQMAGSGPNATNEGMPIGEPRPTLLERQQLAIWIACGAP